MKIKEVLICNNCKHVSCIIGDIIRPRECNHEKAFIGISLISGHKSYKSCRYMRDNIICGTKAILYNEN